jgi:outer membrane protein TolC
MSVAHRFTRGAILAVGLSLVGSATAPVSAFAETPGITDAELAHGIDRGSVVRAVLARSPRLKAQADRVRAMRSMSAAEGRLPDPEVMFQIWQVPFERPVSFSDAQMIMGGIIQSFPAPGSLSARAAARNHAANAEEAILADKARDVVRAAEHAYVDLAEATARHHSHVVHHDVVDKIVRAVEARQAAGGTLDDVTQVQLELARLDADIATEAAAMDRGKAHLNALLARAFDAPLGPVETSEPMMVALTPDALVAMAERARPDLRAADARVAAENATLELARREATLPSFSVGAYYFAPTTLMPFNGYGVSASMTLPWVWGGGARKREAAEALGQAAAHDVDEARLEIGVDVGTAAASARAAAERLRVLRSRALPAAQRALDAAFASYRSGGGGLLGVLRARQAVVDIEMELVMARALLDHALADLDWAVGAPLPRTALLDDTEARHEHP